MKSHVNSIHVLLSCQEAVTSEVATFTTIEDIN